MECEFNETTKVLVVKNKKHGITIMENGDGSLNLFYYKGMTEMVKVPPDAPIEKIAFKPTKGDEKNAE